MTNANDPAFPQTTNGSNLTDALIPAGLSKREWFAGLAMQGFVTSLGSSLTTTHEMIAEWSVDVADKLIAELAKEPK
jgi:hypothetical protein